jgi:hypothetical protein
MNTQIKFVIFGGALFLILYVSHFGLQGFQITEVPLNSSGLNSEIFTSCHIFTVQLVQLIRVLRARKGGKNVKNTFSYVK